MPYWRSDWTVQDASGRAVPNASVYWCVQPTTLGVPPGPLAALYSSSMGGAITNPQVTNGFGQTSAYLTAGTYTVVEVWSGKIQQVYPDQAIGVQATAGAILANPGGPQTIQNYGLSVSALTTPSLDGIFMVDGVVYPTLASALAAMGSGSELVLPPGNYAVNNPLVISQSNVYIHGAGRNNTILTFANDADGLQFTGSKVRLDGLSLSYANSGTSALSYALRLTNAGQMRASNIYAETNIGSALRVESTNTNPTDNVNDNQFDTCLFGAGSGYGIVLAGALNGSSPRRVINTRFDNVQVLEFQGAAPSVGAYILDYVQGTYFNPNCVFQFCDTHVLIAPASFGITFDTFFDDVIFDAANLNEHVRAQNTYDLRLIGCWFGQAGNNHYQVAVISGCTRNEVNGCYFGTSGVTQPGSVYVNGQTTLVKNNHFIQQSAPSVAAVVLDTSSEWIDVSANTFEGYSKNQWVSNAGTAGNNRVGPNYGDETSPASAAVFATPIAASDLETVAFVDKGNAANWSGTDAGGWINSAAAYLNTKYGGGTIYIGAGNYPISTTMGDWSNVTLQGMGVEATILTWVPTTGTLFTQNAGQGQWGIRDLQMYTINSTPNVGSPPEGQATAIYMAYNANVDIENVWINGGASLSDWNHSWGHAITITGNGSGGLSSNIHIDNVRITVYSQTGIDVAQTLDLFASNSTIYAGSSSATGIAIMCDSGCSGVYFDHMSCGNGTHGLLVYNSGGGSSPNYNGAPWALFFTSCLWDSFTQGDAVLFDSTLGGNVVDARFTDCWISSSGANGVNFLGGQKVKWNGGTIRACTNNGILIDSSNCALINISGATITNNNTSNGGNVSGISVNAVNSDVIITDCIVGDITEPYGSGLGNQAYGIYVVTNFPNFIVTGNDLQNNVTGGIYNTNNSSYQVVTGNIPVVTAIGNSSSTNLVALAKGTGTGPTSLTVNAWVPYNGGWIPFFE